MKACEKDTEAERVRAVGAAAGGSECRAALGLSTSLHAETKGESREQLHRVGCTLVTYIFTEIPGCRESGSRGRGRGTVPVRGASDPAGAPGSGGTEQGEFLTK